jgi:hypothetical protein
MNHDYNLNTIKNIKRQLKDDGVVIIDFMNTSFVKKNLVKEEVKIIDNIKFEIKRRYDSNYIIKEIRFNDKIEYSFKEKVMNLSINDFKKYLKRYDLEIIRTFGNYYLEDFKINKSERLIMVIKKSQP